MQLHARRHCTILYLAMAFTITTIICTQAASAMGIRYDGYFGGFKVADVSLRMDNGPTSYTSSMDITAKGVISMFYTWRGLLSAEGTVTPDGTLKPTAFLRQWDDTRDSGTVKIDYNTDTGLALGIEDGKPDDKVSESDRQDVIDPLAALVALQRHVQAGVSGPASLDVYDGKRRMIIAATFQPPRTVTIRDKAWRVISVEADIKPVSGFKDRQRKGWQESRLFVQFTSDGQALPVQIRLDTPVGIAILNVECGIEAPCPHTGQKTTWQEK